MDTYESQSYASLDWAGWFWGKERAEGRRQELNSINIYEVLTLSWSTWDEERVTAEKYKDKGLSLRTGTGMTPTTWAWRRGKMGGRQRQGHTRPYSTGPRKQMSRSVSVKEWPYPWCCSFKGSFIVSHFVIDRHLLHPLNSNKPPMLLFDS